jgi:hypothetical protein
MTIVKFLKGNGYFVAGDTTQLEDSIAADYIKQGVCEKIEFTPETSGFIPPEIPNVPSAPVSKLTCPLCGKTFKTEAALKAHKKKAHGSK